MTRRTSIEAYNIIKANGMLSRRRWEVYDVLFRRGPLTASETFKIIQSEGGRSLSFDSNTHARFTELRDAGVIYEVRERICSVTGRNVIEWDVTERLPVKSEKPQKTKCKHCDGRGYVETQQRKLF